MIREPEPDTLISVPYQPPPRSSSRLGMWAALGGLLVLLGGGAGLAVYCFSLPDDSQIAERKEGETDPPQLDDPLKSKGLDAKGAKEKSDSNGPKNSSAGTKKEPSKKAPDPKKVVPVKKKKPAKFVEPPWVAQAVKNGLAYLRKHVQTDGKWSATAQPAGYAALTGLTLLECGVPGKDPLVQAARKEVLTRVGPLNGTYEIALALLFLDRLGSKADEGQIRTLALRLVAGQKADGGWTYDCPVLAGPDHNQLLRFLRENRLSQRQLVRPEAFQMFIPGQNKTGPVAKAKAKEKPRLPLTANQLPPGLRDLPVVKQGKVEPPQGNGVGGRSDNSNSQFAMLALWIAQKHAAPMERTFNLVDQRYRFTQFPDGAWSYTPDESATKPAMTCAGLLGLAVGHGSAQQVALRDAGLKAVPGTEADPALQDAALQKGLSFVGQNIGHPIPQPNAYFLWSVERVAVLYHLNTIGGKDWYTWGAKGLLAGQNEDGSWNVPNGYPGGNPTADTCFALLFLKKANFVPGLTENLREYLRVRDPADKGAP